MKIKITADKVLQIIKGILESNDATVTDAPNTWEGKTINEVLNVEYYTFKHRPMATDDIIAQRLSEITSGSVNTLLAVDRSFCLCSLNNVERMYSKDIDMVTVSARLEYWLQTNKIQLLEDLIEDCNKELSGVRINVDFGEIKRQAVVIFGNPNVTDIETGTGIGEAAVIAVDVTILLYPKAVSYQDYTVTFTYFDEEEKTSEPIHLANISFSSTMTPKVLPSAVNAEAVKTLNLSRGISFVLVFEAFENDFIALISDRSLDPEYDGNNVTYIMNLIRGEKTYYYNVLIKEHQITTNADTGNETHTLSLVMGE